MGEYGARVCGRIIVLFIAMLAGYIAKKTKCIDGAGIKTMSALLAFITNPCLIVASLQKDCKPEILVTGGWILVLSFVIHGVMAVLSGFIFKKVKKADERAVYAFGLMYMNCGFMGYPIMQAMFPENGLLYGVIYTIPFNLFVWTHGVAVMSSSQKTADGKKKIDWKQVFLNPGLLSTVLASVLFYHRNPLPGDYHRRYFHGRRYDLSALHAHHWRSAFRHQPVIAYYRCEAVFVFGAEACGCAACCVSTVCRLRRQSEPYGGTCVRDHVRRADSLQHSGGGGGVWRQRTACGKACRDYDLIFTCYHAAYVDFSRTAVVKHETKAPEQ